MKRIKSIISFLVTSAVVATVAIGVVGCGKSSTSSSLEEIKKRDTIKIGVFSDKSPFGYVDSNGENQGYDVYIAKRFAKDLLGVVSKDGQIITSEDQLKDKKIIVAKGTTAETYMTKNHPDVELIKYDQYSEIFQALKDGRGDAILSDNTEVIAWAKDNPGFTVGISSLGSEDYIAPAVAKGNDELKDWINGELEEIGKENFIHEAYDKTLKSVYGSEFEESLVVEGGKVK